MVRWLSTLFFKFLWMDECFLFTPSIVFEYVKLYVWTLFIMSISCVDVWFVHLRNHFIPSWVYRWISFYITKWSSSTNDVSKMVPNKLSSMHWISVMARFVYGFIFHNFYPSKVWTVGLWCLLFVHVLDNELVISTISIHPWALTNVP